ncbi:hypothetical protein Pint_13379 [Pistacia integerrima]|uniref:Uncharacterized protein n=1 Tax=Pistacia integerrima TaxID=434235 RepID=A0ACC0Y5T3_9ROSI|nr:hypothetical protein Pint_13379 [Pistacia integerrima]
MEEVANEAEIPISYKAMFTEMEEMRKVSQNTKDVSEHFEHGREILGIHVEMDELGRPMIIMPKEKNRRMSQPWTHSLIIKLMGESIGYMMLKKKVEQLWAHYGNIMLINLGYKFFLAHFAAVEDYDYDLTGGPWLMFDHYLALRQWQPDFDPVVAKIDKISAWVRLLGFSIEYYDVEFLQCYGHDATNCPSNMKEAQEQERRKTIVLEDKVCMEKDIREASYGLILPEPSHNISQFSKKASTTSRRVGDKTLHIYSKPVNKSNGYLKAKSEIIINKLGYKYLAIAEAKGFMGGIWVLWNDVGLKVSVIKIHEQFIMLRIAPQGKLEWICCFVYVSPRSKERDEPWFRLVDFALVRDLWMVVGDFNDISHPSEKKGDGYLARRTARPFRFEVAWTNHADFKTFLQEKWESSDSLPCTKVPLSTCQHIERLQHSFIWGDQIEKRKVHWVIWSTLCKPKDLGGLGIKNLQLMNEALLSKTLGALWSRVLTYIGWNLGNGESPKFWTSSWIQGKPPLVTKATRAITALEVDRTMTSFVDENGRWNFRELSIALPTLKVSKVQKGMELGNNFGSSKPLRDSSSSCGELFLTVYPQMYKRENVLIVMISVLFAWRVRKQSFIFYEVDAILGGSGSNRLYASWEVMEDIIIISQPMFNGERHLWGRNIGRCSALIVEAWAILDRLVGEPGYKVIKRWLHEDWEIHIHHVYLEGNKCADFLANLSFSFDPELYVLESAPFAIDILLRNDASGMFSSRSLCLDVAFML